MTYDPQHRMISQTDANGQITTYVYNGANLASVRPPGPGEGATRMTYDSAGLLLTTTTPVGTQVFTNDAFGNTVRTVRAGPGRPAAERHGQHRRPSTRPAGTTGFASALGIVEQLGPRRAGKVLLDQDARPASSRTPTAPPASRSSSTAFGETTTYAWDEGTLTRTTTSPAGTAVQQYDASGNVLRETSPTGLVTTHMLRRARPRVRSPRRVPRPSATSTTTRATSCARSTAPARCSSQQFDALSRVVRQVGDGLETLDLVRRRRQRHRRRGTPPGGTTTRTYDTHGNPSTVSDAQGTTRYAYDLADNVVSRTDSRGGVTTWTYDPMSRADVHDGRRPAHDLRLRPRRPPGEDDRPGGAQHDA